MRAFLSHSSTDKPFVERVAQELGRGRVVFDKFEFQTGDDFYEAIERGIDRSQLFVLFASKNSLASNWVKFEIEKAEAAVTAKALTNGICYIIDPDVSVDDLPDWMKRCLVTKQADPVLVALDIRRQLNERALARRPRIFVGRNDKAEEALDQITEGVKPMIVYGLPGIGRRTFIGEVARNQLSYGKVLQFSLRAGDELPELVLYVMNSLGRVAPEEAGRFLAMAAAKAASKLVEELLSVFQEVCASGTLPVVVDSGGALTSDDGRLLPGFQTLVSAIEASGNIDLAIATIRRPRNTDGEGLEAIRLAELDATSSNRLIRLLAGHYQLRLDRNQSEALATYVAGYPPAANFAIQEMRLYGPQHVTENQSIIVNFNSRTFINQLKADGRLTSLQQEILKLLSAYQVMPRPVIAEYVSPETDEELDEAMTRLMDAAFISPDGLHYRISGPIRDAAYRTFSGLTVDHGRVATLLEAHLDERSDDDLRLELGEVLFRAASLAGRAQSKHSVGLARDLIEIATQSYFDENYDRVLEYGPLAIQSRPDNVDVRRVVAQALIRRELYDDAEEHIQHMIRVGAPKEAYYVRGFLHRRKHEHDKAIDAYRLSIEYGRRGVAVHRELAQCLFQLGRVDEALSAIRAAEQIDPHNRFVVDLKCTIAMKRGDRAEVDRCLKLLERIDNGSFAFHRRSRFELSQGNAPLARDLARQAVEGMVRPPFAVLANLANCQIEAGELPEAGETLRMLDQRFAVTHVDQRMGLRCKLELRRHNPDVAETFWDRIRDKDVPVHQALRRLILTQKSSRSAEENDELDRLNGNLETMDFEAELVMSVVQD